MKNIILYASKSGNTKKVASSLSSELDAIQFNIHNLTDNEMKDFWKNNQADIYWIGSGVYAGSLEKNLCKFLKSYPPPDDTTLAFFSTWLGRADSANQAIQKLVDQLLNRSGQLTILKPYFLCYGKTLFVRRGHPSPEDLKNAGEWADTLQKNEA